MKPLFTSTRSQVARATSEHRSPKSICLAVIAVVLALLCAIVALVVLKLPPDIIPIPGPPGPPGESIIGPPGPPGMSIVGPPGEPGLNGSRLIGFRVFQTPGPNVYVPTPGTTLIFVECIGGGGAGGGVPTSPADLDCDAAAVGAGGGSGVYGAVLLDPTPGPMTVTVGGGGIPNPVGGTGGAGGITRVPNVGTALCLAPGGLGGQTSNTFSNSTRFATGGAGGSLAGAVGTLLVPGSPGGAGSGVVGCTFGSLTSGIGGGSAYGDGGAAVGSSFFPFSSIGTNGVFGGGGSGSARMTATPVLPPVLAGAGGVGGVIITEYSD